jgi:hypothetical protein
VWGFQNFEAPRFSPSLIQEAEDELDDRNRLAILCARFQELTKHFSHLPRNNRDATRRRLYVQAQEELFRLAQAICELADPAVQARLEEVREEAMAQVRLHVRVPTGARVVTERPRRPLSWVDFQITPEITVDPHIAGSAVLSPILKRLKLALRAQWAILDRTLRSHC